MADSEERSEIGGCMRVRGRCGKAWEEYIGVCKAARGDCKRVQCRLWEDVHVADRIQVQRNWKIYTS